MAALAACVLASERPARAASGGPDGGGYIWLDAAEGVPRTAPGAFVAPTTNLMPAFDGDNLVVPIPLPPAIFPAGFRFYDRFYDTVYLSTEGWLSFIDPSGIAYPGSQPIPDPAPPQAVVAFLRDDLATNRGVPLTAFGRYGPYDTSDAFGIDVVFWKDSEDNRVEIVLFRDGTIRIIWKYFDTRGLRDVCGVGIENHDGDVGTQLQHGVTRAPGFALADNQAVEFRRSGTLDCAAPLPISCEDVVGSSSPPTPADQALTWSCADGRWSGSERVFELVNPVLQSVRFELTTTTNQAVFLTRSCSLVECLAGGVTDFTVPLLEPGTYQLAVDGRALLDDGAFTLAVTCVGEASSLACGSTHGGATSGASLVDRWACSALDFSGPEDVSAFTLATAQNVTARLLASDPGLELVLFGAGAGQDGAVPACLLAGGTSLTAFNLPPGEYGVAVEGVAGASGAFTLELTCGAQLDCTGALPLACGTPTLVAGSTRGRAANVDRYACSPTILSGPEQVHACSLAQPSAVFVSVTPAAAGLEVIVVRDCDEGLCPASSGPCIGELPAGDFELVVDGVDPAGADYQLEVRCLPPESFGRWHECEGTGSASTQPEDDTVTALSRWQFSTAANYCPDSCDFAMYVVVECGQEFHLPLRDVESGHVRVYDYLRDEYVLLEAENNLPASDPNHVLMTGTDIEWISNGCPGAPPEPDASCPTNPPGGCDDRFDNRTMDVRFFGTPSVCGVYRIELLGWGGLVWELFANCTGTAAAGFTIYSNVCDAFANWDALPELQISSLAVTDFSGCPGAASAELTILNTGCAPAVDVPVLVTFSTGDPSVGTTVPLVPAGGSVTVPLSLGPFSGMPVDATITIDAGAPGTVFECHEAGSNPVTCSAPADVVHVRSFTPCPAGCEATAVTVPLGVICEGTTFVLDGSDSLVSGCSGVAQFHWEAVGDPTQVRDWDADPSFLVRPTQTTTYRLQVRCSTNLACLAEAFVEIRVTPDLVPPRVSAPLMAAKSGASDILWTFDAPDDPSVAGLRLYSSHEPRVDGTLRGLVAELPPFATSYLERDGQLTPSRVVYYQLVTVSCGRGQEGPY